MGYLEETLQGKSLADYTNTQLRLALGAVLYTNTADMWRAYLTQQGYTGSVADMLSKYYIDNSVPLQFRNYINAGLFLFNPRQLFRSGEQGYVYDLNDQFAEKHAYRRNLLTWSEQFDNAVWTKTNATVTTNAAVAPDGTTTAEKLVEDTATSTHQVIGASPVTVVTGITYTISVFAKAGERSRFRLLDNSNATNTQTFFDLSDGTIVSESVAGSSLIEYVGSGWYRCSMKTVPAGVLSNPQVRLVNSGTTTSYLGDGASGLFIWGAQLEASASATDYQRVTDWNTELLAAFPQTTLFLDSAGTTPATVNGLVGLVLDKSKGLVRGAEAITTQDLTNVAWVSGGGFGNYFGSTSTSTTITSTGTNGARSFRFAVSAGQFVQSSAFCTLITGTGAGLRMSFGTSGGVLTGAEAIGNQFGVGGGVSAVAATAPANAAFCEVSLVAYGASGSQSSFASITASTLDGNHAYQATTGNKPVLRGTPVGGNIVTNGDFASDVSGWSAASGASISWASGKMRVTNGGAGRGTGEQAFTTVIGKVYRVRFSATAGTSPSAFFGVAQGSGPVSTIAGVSNSLGTDFYFTAVGTTTYVYAQPNFTTAGLYIDVDNIEIHDVSAGQVQAPYALQFDGVDDFLQTASVDFATVTSDGLARRNLLTFPTAFDNAAWTKGNITVTANSTASPDGTVTADTLNEGVATNYHNLTAGSFSAGTYTISVYAKNVDAQYVNLTLTNAGTAYCSAIYDVSNGTVATSGALASGFSVTSTSITSVGDGWYRCVMTCVIATTSQFNIGLTNSTTIGTFGLASYTGTSRSIYVWGAQVEAGSTASTFQNIGTDKMTVCHGVRKLSDASVAALADLSVDALANAGTFTLYAPYVTNISYTAFARGTAAPAGAQEARTGAGAYPAPHLAVYTSTNDIAGDRTVLRLNAADIVTATGDKGAGNFGNYALYFGRRGGTSFPYNGLMFSAICVGKATSATELANIERWTNQRTGAY